MTVSYWSGVTIEVSVAFDKGAADTVVDGDYTDVSAYVRGSVGIERGRSSELDTFQTGTATITLNNRDRRFDPEYSAGPYYGKLLPNRHIRVRMTYAGSTSYLFKGYVSGWPQTWPLEAADRDSTVTITCHDAFKLFARTYLPEDAYKPEILADTPAAWYRLGEANGETIMSDSSGNNQHGTYLTASQTANVATAASGLVTYSPNGARMASHADASDWTTFHQALPYYLTGTTWTVEMWAVFPSADLDSTSSSAQAFAQVTPSTGSATGYGNPQVGISINRVAGVTNLLPGVTLDSSNYRSWSINVGTAFLDQKHHLVMTYNAGTLAFYIDGVDQGTPNGLVSGTLSGSSWGTYATIAGYNNTCPNVVADEVALYTTTLSSARVLAHYNAGAGVYAAETVDARLNRALDLTPYAAFPTSFAASSQTVRGFETESSALLDYLQLAERTEGGQARLFVAADGTLTFHNRYHATSNPTVDTAFTDASGTTYPYSAVEPEYDDSRVVNYAQVSRTNGTPQVAQDTTSQTAYGVMGVNVDGLAANDDASMLDRANALVYAYKTPAQRVRSLTIVPRRNAATLFPKIRTTDIGTRISVRRAPLGVGSAYTKELTIEGISHSFDVDGNWTTTYLTAPTDTADDWLKLDSATQGLLNTNRLGF